MTNASSFARTSWVVFLTAFCLQAFPVHGATPPPLVVYSARAEQLIKPVLESYTRKTGVEVRLLTDKEGPLKERLKSEGKKSPADVLLTVDAGNLWSAAEEGLLAPVDSKRLKENVAAHLRDPENRWFGMSVRARTIFYNPMKVKLAELSTYAALADPKWKGRLCLRTSKKVYNQSLVAMMIAEKGEAEAEKIVKGWVSNLATAPFSDDTQMLKAISAGQCDLGIANTYYFARLKEEVPDLKVALFWPNQESSGVHVNVSGAGVVRHSKHKDQAIALLEWLSSAEAQSLFADVNHEFPANPQVKASQTVTSWGAFKPNLINVSKAGELQVKATQLMDRAGYK